VPTGSASAGSAAGSTTGSNAARSKKTSTRIMSRIEVGPMSGSDSGDRRSGAVTPTSTTILVPFREAETTDPAAGSRRNSVDDLVDHSVAGDVETGSRGQNLEAIYPNTNSSSLVGNYHINPQRSALQS